MIEFKLGGVVIPIESLDNHSERFTSKRRSTDLLMGDGSTLRQTLSGTEDKLKIRLSGGGWAPIGLTSLDYSSSMTLLCGLRRSIGSASNVITIPSARRSDSGFEPIGLAVVDGELQETTISIVSNEATLGVVAGAEGYQVQYWPEITVYADLEESMDASSATYSWEIIAEEI